jgi:outer membrane protein assembly factor BamB
MRLLSILFSSLMLSAGGAFAAEPAWPQFRGADGQGIAGEGRPPVQFGPTQNVLWKVELPSGNSSPCVWGNKIFLTGFDKTKLETLCLDRKDGKVLWRVAAPVEKFETIVQKLGNPATPTPACDGERVYVYFGSFGLLAYDLEGKEQWRHPLPVPIVEFGASSSPILTGDLLIQNCDQDMNSFLIAVDRRTGKQVWKTDRAEFRRGFSTPYVWRHDGTEELVVAGSLWVKSYSLKDGKELWSTSGMARVSNASPIAGDGLLYISSWNVGGDPADRITMEPVEKFLADNDKDKDGKLTIEEFPKSPVRDRFSQIDVNKDKIVTVQEYNDMAAMFVKAENALFAIKPGGRGDITKTHIVWKQMRSLPYVSSPLYYNGRIYTMKDGGLASCYDAKTGKVIYQDERVGAEGAYYSSAAAVNGMIYVTSQKGDVVVYPTSDTLDVVARNKIGEQVLATPAFVDGKIYLRADKHLFAFGH